MTREFDHDEVMQVARRVFRATRTQSPESFQEYALAQVRRLISFDACKWGSGIVLEGRATIHNVHLHNLPADDLERYRRYQGQDVILARMIATRDRVVTYDRYELIPRERFVELPIYTEYCRRYGLEQLISTMVPEPVSNLFSVVSFFRRDPRRPFSAREKRIKTLLTPVLTEARSQNIFIHMLRNGREPERFAAIADVQGVLWEAEPDFAALMQVQWPGWQGPRLPFAPGSLLAGRRSARFDGERIGIDLTPLHDLVLLQARRRSPLDGLTPAERRVAGLLLRGHSDKEIAAELGVSPKTVGNHLQRIYRKTGVGNRKQAIARLGGEPR